MATSIDRIECVTCRKTNVTSKCTGCAQDFCSNHFIEHRQQLRQQLDQIERDGDLFRQTLNQPNTSLIEKVDQWEQESIEKIRQTAQEIRHLLSMHTSEHLLKVKLEQFIEQLKRSRAEDEIIEGDLQKWQEQLKQLTQQINKPSTIVIQQSEIPLINKIQVQFSGKYIP